MKKKIINRIAKLILSMTVAICAIGMFGCTQPESPHVHTFSEAWTTDATSHWHAATCEHTTEVSGKVDHLFPETWKQVTAATEEAAGLEERFCEVCNYRATQVIPQLNHNHDIEKVWSTDSTKHWHTASCGREEHNEDVASHIWKHEDYQYDSVSGKDIRTCKVCLYVDDTTHCHTWNHEDYRYDSVSGKEIRTCTNCLYVDDKTHNHTEDTGTVTSVPSCTTTGIKTYKCTVCNGVVRTEELPVRGHSEDSGTVTTPATCVTKGIKTYKCTVCRGIVRTEKLPITSHTEDSGTVTTPATCGTKGVKTYKCTVCDAVQRTEAIPETGLHTEDSGTVTTPATCGTKGVKTYKCTVCDAVQRTEAIPETGLHTEDSGTVTTKPTCVTKGVKTVKCSVCDAVLKTEEIPATGLHTEDSGTVTTEPTCVTKGVKTFKCSVCDAVQGTEKISELYSTPIDVTTGTTPTAESKYIYFGVFPRDVLPTTSTVTVDETVFVEMGANTYYLGSDGNYYAKCAENAYGTGAQYKYHDGTQPGTDGNTTRYFKVEPIKWLVLTDNYSGKKLLLAEEILTANVPYYEDYNNNRSINGKTIYPNNYKHSQIRAYLNGLTYQAKSNEVTNWNNKGFLQTAFTQEAQALIAETDVDNSKETTGYSESTYAADYACENTTDKIFLLSESEVINSDYGFAAYNSKGEGNARIRFPTDYAKANYAYQSTTDGYGDFWWLRSPYNDDSRSARGVWNDGYASSCSDVHHTQDGVVPALSISF